MVKMRMDAEVENVIDLIIKHLLRKTKSRYLAPHKSPALFLFVVEVQFVPKRGEVAGLEDDGHEPQSSDRRPAGEPVEGAGPGGRMGLVVGNEGAGLTDPVRARCARMVAVPMRVGTESLNVAAAAAILLYELTQKR